MNVCQKLKLLRNEMLERKIDIYIIPSIDAHNSEYVPQCFARRSWISDFNGSSGEVIVTMDQAYLWTDGRYFLQAENQLDSKFYTLMKQSGFVPEIESWLVNNAKNKVVGIDPTVFSINRVHRLEEALAKANAQLKIVEENLVDLCKSQLNQITTLPSGQAFMLEDKYTGKSIETKIDWLKVELANNKVDHLVLNALDEIAWLFNIRGTDIEYNPLLISFAIISKDSIQLFADINKFSTADLDKLQKAHINILPYHKFNNNLGSLNGTVWVDDKIANYSILNLLNDNCGVVFGRSPIVLAKACKNQVEQDGARVAHIKDAVAVINFLNWLEINLHNEIDEIAAADQLTEFRKADANLRGLSFASISGFASNGAVIHYHATPETNKKIDDSNLYLIDSGGQYLEGTTDITRTLHFGTPTEEQKRHYTIVLKGHLALGRTIFPHGTCGEHLDALARAPLWNEYLNYRHGTGHGVGSFLCVHEGPQKISVAISGAPLLPGMIVSNEPGFYLDGQYGIRIENLCLINQLETANNSEYGPFYYFEDLTLVPYAKRLIDVNLLTNEDKQQISRYYARIRKIVWPLLKDEQQQWLDNELNLFC